MMVPATTLQLHLMAPSTIRALLKFRLALLFRALRHQARARCHRSAVRELRAMSDLELCDLGIGRSQIAHAAHSPPASS